MAQYTSNLSDEQFKNYMYNINTLGKLLNQERNKYKISVKQIAARAGCDNSTIYRFERGDRTNALTTVARILQAFQELKNKVKNNVGREN